MAKYRILSLDGGGIRGIITAIILQRLSLDQQLAGWLDPVELIAGTSTGGLIALGLAYGLGIHAIRELYETKGKEIFHDTWLDDLVNIGKLIAADYSNQNLQRELKGIFGQATLDQLQRRVLITSFDLDNESADPMRRTWKPKLFHNFPGEDSDGAELAYKVGLYTSAAPTYFPAVDGFVDGGVYASNPSMCALAQSQDNRNPDQPPISEIVLLSLGTGTSLSFVRGNNLDWGYIQWAKPLLEILLDGTAGIADYQCKQILGARYHRLAPVFSPGVSIPMDEVDSIPYMIEFAERLDLSVTREWLNTHWL